MAASAKSALGRAAPSAKQLLRVWAPPPGTLPVEWESKDRQRLDWKTVVKLSRPGWWLVHVWLYLAPTGQMYELLSTWSFWLGLLYAVFPLNLLVYGLNDYTDVELDAKNDRKGNFMYGAKCSPEQMQALPHLIVLMNVGGIALLAAVTGRWAALTVWLVICFAVNGAYNLPPLCLSSRGPWELPCVVVGFSGVAPLASIVNQIGWPPLGFVAHMTCLVLRTQLWTEFLDYEPDLACGRRTTSTLVGKAWSKVLVVFFLVAEAAVTFYFFDDVLLMISTCVGVVAFVCLEVVTGTTDQEKKKAMKVQTGVGFSLVFWIWYRGLFAARPL